jgi:hypothetical protein
MGQHQIYDEMLGEGWTLAAAAGDSGFSDDCSGFSVDYPASDPDVLAAGGTALSLDSSGNFISEPAWSGNGCQQQNGGGGGGGCSGFFLQPFYQAVDGISCNGAALRTVPDVALNAGSGQIVIFAGKQFVFGGTSIVAPELAGFVAHENAYLLRLNNLCAPSPCAPLGGFAAWALYHATAAPSTHDPFYDVVTGCNSSALGQGFCTGPGYDLATGWGSFNFLQMAWDVNRMLMNDPKAPITAFGSNGPKINQWYHTNQILGWAAVDSDPNPAHVISGVAGATVGWDTIDANPFSHATPGSGDAFYRGPALPHTTLGGLNLKDAGQGCHTAHLLAFDNVGNASTASYGPVCYDSVPPVTTAHVSGTIGGRGIYLGPVQVTLTATDVTSGVASTTYRVDCITCPSKTYTSPITVTGSGLHAIFFRSTDKAGNAEVPQTLSFTVH